MDQDHIDTLLERYLSLLDEYTRLRTQLSRLQSDVFHGIARANFAAERGLRYGRDQYDERMRAGRLLSITARSHEYLREEDTPEFTITNKPDEKEEDAEQREKDTEESVEAGKTEDGEKAEKQERKKKSDDPLRWFGLLTPMPLRNAQTQSIEVVEHLIPRLATVSAEMQGLEIEVRRARKKRAKAEAAEQKVKDAEGKAEADNAPSLATAVETAS